MHVTPARQLLLARRATQAEHNGTTIEIIAFLIAHSLYTLLSKTTQTRGTLAAQNLNDSELREPSESVSHGSRWFMEGYFYLSPLSLSPDLDVGSVVHLIGALAVS